LDNFFAVTNMYGVISQSNTQIERRNGRPDPNLHLVEGEPRHPHRPVLRSVGLGLISGAADDDPSAIGTYASAGAKFAFSLLWAAPAAFPMMVAVTYLCSKMSQVTGHGLFEVIREHYPRWLLHLTLIGVVIGNTIEAGADLGGVAAGVNLLIPIPIPWIVFGTAAVVFGLQVFGSYELIRNIFRWLALALLAYVGSAFLAKPPWLEVIKATLIPTVQFNRDFLAILVAMIGTSLSAYLYTWQSNQEVEEEISMGRKRLEDRRGTTPAEINHAKWDIILGMLFSSVIIYFIMLSTAATLHKAGKTDITSAAQAAQALVPLAGKGAGLLFALGMVGVGFLAIPVMTTGAAYDLCQTVGWKYGLHAKPKEAKQFYASIAIVTFVAAAVNLLGINPMKALVWAGIVQGISTPALMLFIMLITNNRKIMGRWTNSAAMNVLGWITTAAIFAAALALLFSFA
jgi:NRAMP (natural resistance-associated macrophage protein)-like metal ion transporter